METLSGDSLVNSHNFSCDGGKTDIRITGHPIHPNLFSKKRKMVQNCFVDLNELRCWQMYLDRWNVCLKNAFHTIHHFFINGSSSTLTNAIQHIVYTQQNKQFQEV